MGLPKISFDRATQFFNSRNLREKTMLIIFVICFVLVVDALLFIQPSINSFFRVQPELRKVNDELKELELDKRDAKKIESEWRSMNDKLEKLSSRFVSSSEVSAETLSRLAQESNVKISSLTPSDKPRDELAGSYKQVLIKIRGMAGAHSLGKFLAKVESDSLFFKIGNLTIKENEADDKSHDIEMSVECYRKL